MFNYQAYENDPQPLIFFINAIKGIHPNTGHQWRLIQGININYIPRKDRKKFVKLWRDTMATSKSVKFTWLKVKSQFPYIKFGIRRYMLKPNYYMKNLQKIEVKDWDKVVVKHILKDFSGQIKRKIASKMKSFFTRSKKKKRRT